MVPPWFPPCHLITSFTLYTSLTLWWEVLDYLKEDPFVVLYLGFQGEGEVPSPSVLASSLVLGVSLFFATGFFRRGVSIQDVQEQGPCSPSSSRSLR